ncbi:MAG: L,D-transpeptidase family protein [Gammaproteobacteria bacterium]
MMTQRHIDSITRTIGLALMLAGAAIQGAWAVNAGHHDYELEIIKSERMLLLKRGAKIEKVFRMASGRGGPGDKRYRGDHRTPVGTYRVVKIKRSSRFHTFLQLNYPNVKDAFHGLRGRTISEYDFDRIVSAQKYHEIPPQNTALGGAIGIHGIGAVTPRKFDIHQNVNWTEGCIALTNEQIDTLRKFVEVGTKVVIAETLASPKSSPSRAPARVRIVKR